MEKKNEANVAAGRKGAAIRDARRTAQKEAREIYLVEYRITAEVDGSITEYHGGPHEPLTRSEEAAFLKAKAARKAQMDTSDGSKPLPPDHPASRSGFGTGFTLASLRSKHGLPINTAGSEAPPSKTPSTTSS